MLETFYRQLFQPQEAPPSLPGALLIGGLVLLVITLNAGGSLRMGSQGLLLLFILFGLASLLGLFWLSASLGMLLRLLGETPDPGQLWVGIVTGLWPLLLSGCALAMQRWTPALGGLWSAVIALGTLATLTLAIAQTQTIPRLKVLVAITAALGLSLASLGGLIVWPIMLFWGL
ncbi:hypothetical protein [Lyngbya confervoides]|uniref:Yip1 domain-containing protein n=1 Tax=Lyngbya confervoides BDU141951 TaxID=1574623 RepID=A0ABD4SY29_9CYAN|nr:hypothetical protein [Lyngbya confervoides]MCM1981396.1 hypothetical protein [Lyngbya confervoides BDU141951]